MPTDFLGSVSQAQEQIFNQHQQSAYNRLLTTTALRIRQSAEVDDVLKATIADMRKILRAERVLLYRLDLEGTGVVVEESVTRDFPEMKGKNVFDPCFAQYWLPFYEMGRIQTTADIYEDGLSQCHIDFLAQFQIRANLVVPILRPSLDSSLSPVECLEKVHKVKSPKLWGLLAVQQCSAPRQWHSAEIEWVDQMAVQIELALHHADLRAATQQEFILQQCAEAEIRRLQQDCEQHLRDRIADLETTTQTLQLEITERRSLERSLFAEKELAQTTLESIGDGVITTDSQGNIQYFNPVAEQLTGWKLEEVKGLPLGEVLNLINELTRRAVANPVMKVLQSGLVVGLANNTLLMSRDGTEYPIEDSASPIRARNGEVIGAVMVFHDVTQARYLSRQLSWQANHDELTGLFNRRAFERQLTDALIGARSQKQSHTLCYLDLDQFKIVNDTCGHAAGDQLLRQITALLQERVRLTDTLARLGGDEFGLLLHQCPLSQAEQVVDNLRSLIQNYQFIWKGKVFKVGVSIGLVAINAESETLDSVLRAADAACYAAKEKGRNCIYIYQTHDHSLIQRQSEKEWINRIEQALNDDRFQLYAQKITPLTPHALEEHSEVLLRLVDETGELILPGSFIPAAERYRLISSIDQWVIKTFLANYHDFSKQAVDSTPPPGRLYNINLSGSSVNDEQFLPFLKSQLAEYCIPPERICFEITETTAIANLQNASRLIHSVKELGCSFALDDFGSGMSSLAYLKHLPIDYLKIDGGFVKEIASDRMDYAMVECFNNLSHFMGIQTIAECVEDESTLQTLQTIGVDYAQGFCLSEPAPLVFI
jgi:diguanylate cyclase (GGDEF)-like protein/PAS domain S-box-containing protein